MWIRSFHTFQAHSNLLLFSIFLYVFFLASSHFVIFITNTASPGGGGRAWGAPPPSISSSGGTRDTGSSWGASGGGFGSQQQQQQVSGQVDTQASKNLVRLALEARQAGSDTLTDLETQAGEVQVH